MNNEYERFFQEFELNEPSNKEAIKELEVNLNIKLPNGYIEFLLFSNGGEGTIGETYLALWRIEDILELNESYGVEEFAPGLL